MSRTVDTIIVEPKAKSSLMHESFLLNPVECPWCNGLGYHEEEKVRNEVNITVCKKCDGSKKVKALVQISWMSGLKIIQHEDGWTCECETIPFHRNIKLIEQVISNYPDIEIERISTNTLMLRELNKPGWCDIRKVFTDVIQAIYNR